VQDINHASPLTRQSACAIGIAVPLVIFQARGPVITLPSHARAALGRRVAGLLLPELIEEGAG
jgi:hypothetical protein